jgi:hypothetical protein
MSTLNDMKFKSIMAKRKNPYQGNSEMDPEQFAHGGMSGMNDGGKMMAEGGSVDKKKSAVMAIIAKIGKKPMDSVGKSPDEMEMEMKEEGGSMDSAKEAAASEVMESMKSGDVGMFSAALENFIKACGSYED